MFSRKKLQGVEQALKGLLLEASEQIGDGYFGQFNLLIIFQPYAHEMTLSPDFPFHVNSPYVVCI